VNEFGFLDNNVVNKTDYLGLTYCQINVHLDLSENEIKMACRTSAGKTAPFGCFGGALLHKQGAGSKGEVRKCGFFSSKVKFVIPFSMCEGDIYVRKNAPAITIAHELQHANHYKTWYNNYASLVKKVTNKCVCPDCLDAMINWMKVQLKIYSIETEIADLQTDIIDYPKVSAGGQQWANLAKQVQGSINVTLSLKKQEALQLKKEMENICSSN